MRAEFKVIIPARHASGRLPGKPLRDLAGKPLIQRVYENAACSRADEVVVATDDARIASCVEAFGGQVCRTAPGHRSGSDRVAEAAAAWPQSTIVVNVQGDEPFIAAADIEAVAGALAQHDAAAIATLAVQRTDADGRDDPNVVKVVCDGASYALYFSRRAIPSGDGPWLHHVGIYAYRRASLERFTSLPSPEIETREKLEQLRALWHGDRIHVSLVQGGDCLGIDSEADLEKAARHWSENRG